MSGGSHFGWAAAATLAVHTLLAVGIDAAGVYGGGDRAPTPPPRIELVDVLVQPPPPPPPALPPPPTAPPEPLKSPPPPRTPRAPRAVKATAPPPSDPAPLAPPPPADLPIDPGAGGGEPFDLGDVAPAAQGLPVGGAPGGKGRSGARGVGNGAGSGVGSGIGPGAQPASIASIKTRAMPRGDYGYFDAGREYPPDARRLGIEGTIKVRLLVDAAGKVVQRSLLNRLGHGLDELALRRAAAIEFEPARDTDDKAVASVVVWTFNFELPD